jgi:cobalt transporter subunit CbtB
MSSSALPKTHTEAQPAIRPRTVALTAIAIVLALLTLYAVFLAEGTYLHELAHDGRHLFGAPCH